MQEVIVVARAVARPGSRDQVERLLREVIAPTRAEQGALVYSIGRSTGEPDVFTAIERWRTEADLQRHLASDHVRRLTALLPDLLAEPLTVTAHRELPPAPAQVRP
jgi:quinol monooxygenase YgiN